MKKNKDKNLLTSGLIIGSLLGASIAFFLAPKRGGETQKNLINKLNDWSQKLIIKTQNNLLKLEILLQNSSKNTN